METTGPGLVPVTVIGGSAFYVNGMDMAGQGGFPRGLVNNDYKTCNLA